MPTIVDLDPRDDFDDTCNVPVDDGVQTFKVTGSQIKAFVESFLSEKLIPVGTIMPFAGDVAPAGFLLCNGDPISRDTYQALFDVVGERFGEGDGATTFNLPDFRGRFLRGVDGSANRDPDKASRAAMNTGGATGNNVGSVQGHAFQGHNHTDAGHTHTDSGHVHGYFSGTGPGGVVIAAGGGASVGASLNSSASAAVISGSAANIQNANASGPTAQATLNETRPVNAYVNYMIKF